MNKEKLIKVMSLIHLYIFLAVGGYCLYFAKIYNIDEHTSYFIYGLSFGAILGGVLIFRPNGYFTKIMKKKDEREFINQIVTNYATMTLLLMVTFRVLISYYYGSEMSILSIYFKLGFVLIFKFGLGKWLNRNF